MVGYGWHPPRGQATEEHFAQAESLLDAFFDEALAEFGAGDGRAVLLGFSQGGGMTYRMGLGRPDRFAAPVALSATLPRKWIAFQYGRDSSEYRWSGSA